MEESGRNLGLLAGIWDRIQHILWEYWVECETKTCTEFRMELVTVSGILDILMHGNFFDRI